MIMFFLCAHLLTLLSLHFLRILLIYLLNHLAIPFLLPPPLLLPFLILQLQLRIFSLDSTHDISNLAIIYIWLKTHQLSSTDFQSLGLILLSSSLLYYSTSLTFHKQIIIPFPSFCGSLISQFHSFLLVFECKFSHQKNQITYGVATYYGIHDFIHSGKGCRLACCFCNKGSYKV